MSRDPFLDTLFGSVQMGADLVVHPEEFVMALRRLGYHTDPDDAIGAIPAASEIQALVQQAEPHIDAFSDGITFDELLAALELIVPIAGVVDAIRTADFDVPTPADVALDWLEISEDVAVRLPQMLFFDLVEHRAGWFAALLELLGLTSRSRSEFPEVERGGVPFESVVLDVAGFGRLIEDPEAYFSETFFSDGAIDVDRIGRLLERALGGIVSVHVSEPDDEYISAFLGDRPPDEPVTVRYLRLERVDAPLSAVELVIGPHRPGNDPAASADSMVVAARATELDPAPIDVGVGELTIDVPSPSVGIGVEPDGDVGLVAELVGDVAATLAVDADPVWTLFGGDDGPRVELAGLDTTLRFSPDDGDIELSFALRQLALRLDSQGSDSFLANLVNGIAVELDADVSLSRLHGVRFNADPHLELRLPLTLTIGPITISGIVVGAAIDGDTFNLSIRVDSEAAIGPLRVAVTDVGVKMLASSGDDGFDFSLGLDPPNRVAFSFEASDAVSGGGFLDIDHDIGRYAGGAALKVVAVGMSAITVIDTKLPGDDDGWAFFASLGIDIPGIPIGFGFTLEGVGGIIALNRRIDGDALALGLRQGAVDAIMFPDDPVRDAAILIPQIDTYFPIDVGNTVVGPVVEIGWGVPVALVTAQIGVVISLPQGLIVILGSVSMALPTPAAPLIEINLDSIGVIDLAAGTITVTASLYDSRLLGIIELSGDMAFYLATLPSPYFALSIGGWHPAFQPPDRLPSVFTGLRRIRAEIALTDSVMVSFESYLAITPNTVQFGGRFELEASVKVVLVTYTARGWFGFDVLLVFSPFKLVADVSAGVAVYAGDNELMGVSLGVHVEGPEPWFASGYAEFKFFGVNVKFDFTVGGKAANELAPVSNVLTLIAEQLDAPSAWEVVAPSGIAAGLVLRDTEAAGTDNGAVPPIRPDAQLIARQTVAPLERELGCYGLNRVAQSSVGVDRVDVVDHVTGESLDGIETSDVVDWFSPSQFEKLTDAQKLARPSYEQMTSGVSIGADGVGVGPAVAVLGGHETLLWEPSTNGTGIVDRVGIVRGDAVADGWFDIGAVNARAARRPTVLVPQVAVDAVEFDIVEGQFVPDHAGTAIGAMT